MSYPTHITNIYELLNEDGSEGVPRVVTDKEETKKASAPKTSSQQAKGQASTTQGKAQAPSKRTDQKQGGERRERPQGERPPRTFNRPEGERRERPAATTDGEGFGEVRERRNPEGSENRGERRSRGAPAGGFAGNKRIFDRKSGTGRGKEIKKGGGGRGNWGREGEGSEPAAEGTWEEGKEPAAVVEEPVEEVKLTAEEEEEIRVAKEEREKEEKMMTLDDYLKQKAAKGPVAALPEARKANEGVDQKDLKKWGAYTQLKKDDDEVDESSESKEERKKKEKGSLPLDQVFYVKEAPRNRDGEDRGGFRGRGGRGGRGGFRGDRGRGGSRGGDRGSSRGSRGGARGGFSGSKEVAPQFDENSFPTLATKA